jgi:hypothetical protein
MGVGKMSKCQCDLRTKLVGDGCRYCNAQEYIDKLIESLEEQRTWVGLTDDDRVLIKHDANYNQFMTAGEYAERVQLLTEARLKDKNT